MELLLMLYIFSWLCEQAALEGGCLRLLRWAPAWQNVVMGIPCSDGNSANKFLSEKYKKM